MNIISIKKEDMARLGEPNNISYRETFVCYGCGCTKKIEMSGDRMLYNECRKNIPYFCECGTKITKIGSFIIYVYPESKYIVRIEEFDEYLMFKEHQQLLFEEKKL